jgi:hypothetical protein
VNTRQPCPVDELQISAISVDEWRVADSRLSDRSPSKVLGFIQRRNGGFEVLNIDSPDEDITYSDWKSAVEYFSTEEVGNATL